MSHLFQALAERVDAWRTARYDCPDFPAIREILDFAIEDPATGQLRYLRHAQFRALETYWYLRLVLNTPRIPDLYATLFPKPKERREAMGLTAREIVDMIADDGLDTVLERLQTDNAFVRKHGLESLRETFALDYPSYILALAMGAGKTILTEDGPLKIDVPRDRAGSFEPLLIPKHERRFTGFDDKIVAMYARGMTIREIQGFLAEQYGTAVSPEFISSVTDAVMAEVAAWQSRPLEAMYPVVFFDALRVKIREDAVVRNKAIYLALGVLPDGTRDILGLWIENTEGAKFWMKVFNDLKTRGVADILIAVTDGLKGMPEALAAVFPATTLQTCIVHLIRNSLDYASWKDRKALAAAIKPIYTAPSAEAALAELDAFEQGPWGEKFPTVAAAWRRAWDRGGRADDRVAVVAHDAAVSELRAHAGRLGDAKPRLLLPVVYAPP